MKVVGLVVEYNPFHNGHLYHLEKSKELASADSSICIMSGNFIQRGEPALVNKWARAKMALAAGVDLVIELPMAYAMSSAEFFSFGAVSILNSLGVVDYLCFGSESGEMKELELIAHTLLEEPENYRKLLKSNLSAGLSYPAARELALADYFSHMPGQRSAVETVMGLSNNILGIEYLKALKRVGSNITPLTISRVSNSYNTPQLTGSISSATAIRKSVLSASQGNLTSDIMKALPPSSISVLEEEFSAGRGPIFLENYSSTVISFFRRMTAEQISSLPYVSEGLENRIKEGARISATMEELIDSICTKRYTRTRIQRILFSALTGLTAYDLDTFAKIHGPQYIRVLGFNEKGRRLLSEINEKALLPVIIKASDFKNFPNPLLGRMLEIEAQGTDMYVLGYPNSSHRKGGQEFTQNIIYAKD